MKEKRKIVPYRNDLIVLEGNKEIEKVEFSHDELIKEIERQIEDSINKRPIEILYRAINVTVESGPFSNIPVLHFTRHFRIGEGEIVSEYGYRDSKLMKECLDFIESNKTISERMERNKTTPEAKKAETAYCEGIGISIESIYRVKKHIWRHKNNKTFF